MITVDNTCKNWKKVKTVPTKIAGGRHDEMAAEQFDAGDLMALVRESTTPNLRDLKKELVAAHDYLVKEISQHHSTFRDSSKWGIKAKRDKVELPKKNRPALVSQNLESHCFVEILNQCATVERLLDVLDWVSENAEMKGFRNRICHPTTTSRSKSGGNRENDLMLVNGTMTANFEISDVASNKDGNRKLPKDLISLGVLDKEWKPTPDNRYFLGISFEFSQRLLINQNNSSERKSPNCYLRLVYPLAHETSRDDLNTYIWEVMKQKIEDGKAYFFPQKMIDEATKLGQLTRSITVSV